MASKPAKPAPPATMRVAMVHVQDPRARWNVPATDVLRIVSVHEWRGAAPRDLLTALGPLPANEDDAHRVVVARTAGDHETALLAAGAIKIIDVDAADVLPLPGMLAASSPGIAAIILAQDTSLSLLLDPVAIAPPDAALVRNHA